VPDAFLGKGQQDDADDPHTDDADADAFFTSEESSEESNEGRRQDELGEPREVCIAEQQCFQVLHFISSERKY